VRLSWLRTCGHLPWAEVGARGAALAPKPTGVCRSNRKGKCGMFAKRQITTGKCAWKAGSPGAKKRRGADERLSLEDQPSTARSELTTTGQDLNDIEKPKNEPCGDEGNVSNNEVHLPQTHGQQPNDENQQPPMVIAWLQEQVKSEAPNSSDSLQQLRDLAISGSTCSVESVMDPSVKEAEVGKPPSGGGNHEFVGTQPIPDHASSGEADPAPLTAVCHRSDDMVKFDAKDTVKPDEEAAVSNYMRCCAQGSACSTTGASTGSSALSSGGGRAASSAASTAAGSCAGSTAGGSIHSSTQGSAHASVHSSRSSTSSSSGESEAEPVVLRRSPRIAARASYSVDMPAGRLLPRSLPQSSKSSICTAADIKNSSVSSTTPAEAKAPTTRRPIGKRLSYTIPPPLAIGSPTNTNQVGGDAQHVSHARPQRRCKRVS